MALIEQLICGFNPESPDSGRSLLSHSPSMGANVTEEILSFCNGWGDESPSGLSHPAVLSFPLRATMPSIRGQLYAIVRVSTGYPACFHSVVMSKSDYRNFGYNPFAVVKAGAFLDVWSGGERLARGTIAPINPNAIFSPPPNPADVGMVDEAVQEFLTRGKLVLPIEASCDQSDRILSLMIRLMPLVLREKLRFASFTRAGENAYTLAAVYSKDTPFTSWQRLFMTLIEQVTPEPVRKYVASVRNALLSGDFAVADKAEWGNAKRKPATPTQPAPALEPVSSSVLPFHQEASAGPKPSLSTRSFAPTPKVSPAIVTALPGSPGATGGRSSAAPSRRSYADKPVHGKRSRLVRQTVRMGGRHRRQKSQAVVTFLVIVAVLASAWLYLDRSGKGKEWGLFDLANWGGSGGSGSKAPSLLEVVDVGREYSKMMGTIERTGLVPGTNGEQARRRAQADLQAKIAGPLLVQADLFLELAEDGIKQGNRPDREKDRLGALDNQGRVLEEELVLLDLAYFSLKEGVLWRDLDHLNHLQAKARRDSLVKFAKIPMADSAREVGTASYWRSLKGARKNVSGMAALLELFQASTWSPSWEKQLKRAAEKVSPSASPMSRAYRNNAFTLLRLKKSERQEANELSAFASEIRDHTWPSPQVEDILGEMRRKASLYGQGQVPELLVGIMEVHAQLDKPQSLIEKAMVSGDPLVAIQKNPAYKFDPAVYAEHVNRIRFEAVQALLAQGHDPSEIPRHLREGMKVESVLEFNTTLQEKDTVEDWESLAKKEGDTFIGRWSRQQIVQVQQRNALMRKSHDLAWARCLPLIDELKGRSQDGRDWTSTWVDLMAELDAVLSASPVALRNDPRRSSQWNETAELKNALTVQAPLNIHSTVIRLEQEMLPGPAEVEVHFQVSGASTTFGSPRIQMGPAAPQGTGWVGTASLQWSIPVSAQDDFSATVYAAGNPEPILIVSYPSLAERVGPGALERPRRAEGGSLVFRTDGQWWSHLQFP